MVTVKFESCRVVRVTFSGDMMMMMLVRSRVLAHKYCIIGIDDDGKLLKFIGISLNKVNFNIIIMFFERYALRNGSCVHVSFSF